MTVVMVGAGPNLGLAVAKRFGREGLAVGLVSRTQSKLDELARQLQADGIAAAGAAADIRDSDALASARMLHDELTGRGVHVAHTAIGGRIAPGSDHDPDDIADVLWTHGIDRTRFQTLIGIPDSA